MNTKKLIALTLIVVLIYAGIALWGDVGKLRHLISSFAWWTFFAGIGLAFSNYVLRFLKWQFYLKRLGIEGVPASESFVIFLSGFAMSITPAKAGEVFKSALLQSARGVPIARSAPIVVADRLTDLISLILIVALGSVYFDGGWRFAAAAAGLVAALMLFVLVRPLGEWSLSLIERLGPLRAIAPKLRQAYAALRVVASPAALLYPTLLSLVAWSAECCALWLILRGLGQDVSVPVAFFTYATATIAGAVMMLPGGVGGTEGMMILLLQRLTQGAIVASAASAATLLVRLVTLWFAVVLGAAAYFFFRARYDRGLAPDEGAGATTS